jgi:short-subunit dehydrogenase
MEKQKIVFITGASSGIGLRTADCFIMRGDRVYNGSRDGCVLRGVENLETDVSDPDSIQNAVKTIIDKDGRIDIAVYCAGFTMTVPTDEAHRKDYTYLYEVNLFGAAEFCKAVTPRMKECGAGRILLVSSLAGILPIPYSGFYSSSKAALNALATALNIELEPYGIYVSVILPGGTRTPLTRSRKVIPSADPAAEQRELTALSVLSDTEQDGMSARKVARAIMQTALSDSPAPVRIVGFKNNLSAVAARLLPPRIMLKALKKKYKLEQGDKD